MHKVSAYFLRNNYDKHAVPLRENRLLTDYQLAQLVLELALDEQGSVAA